MTELKTKIISAGAGSGKTYRLTREMSALLTGGQARPGGIIATTFTKKAAAELRERVRVALLEAGMTREANELANALIGTVHGLGVKLLKRFAFEAGVSPRVDIIGEGEDQRYFNLSMAAVTQLADIERIEELCTKLGLSQSGEKYNWRKDVLGLVEVIRGNNFSAADIEKSRQNSWSELAKFLPQPDPAVTLEVLNNRLKIALDETYRTLTHPEAADQTKKTMTAASSLRRLLSELKQRGYLPWPEYAGLGKFDAKVGAKSREAVATIVELGERHAATAAFQDDLRGYQDLLFRFAAKSIAEYDRFKKSRGRIDYTDMEVLVLELLDNNRVREVLREELDLLMVDEFQDTSPIQLAIFLKLSQLARRSVWVGDPKQSIYGFRGAEPRLMAAVMAASGPILPENIQRQSWRSREDVVHACNGLFVNAFPEFPPEAVVLEPVRTRGGGEHAPPESTDLSERNGLVHWDFQLEGKERYSAGWLMSVTAKSVREMLENPPPVVDKAAKKERPLRPGDIAILCRSNYGCADMAEALSRQGLAAAISRTGLLHTAEATLLLACLKYLLNQEDSLSIAEINLLGDRSDLPTIIENRLDFLEAEADRKQENEKLREAGKPLIRKPGWSENSGLVKKLIDLQAGGLEYSTSELINLLLEQLDLRRVVVAWGDGEQRLSNIDELRRLAVTYEENCHQQHRAASLGGYLLYLDQLLRDTNDKQGAGERPEAVNVMTYHRSKGLEWPAVICFNLDQPERADVWGRAVIAETETVDLTAPLAGRWLRYWVNPYGRSSNGVPWVDALNESKWKQLAEAEARAEEARLLYVGFTRARDYLILPTGKNGAKWVDRVFSRGGKTVTTLEPGTIETPFSHGGVDVDKYTQVWTEPKTLPASDRKFGEIPFLTGCRPGPAVHTVRVVDEEWILAAFPGLSFSKPTFYHATVDPDPATDPRILSQAIGSYLHGDWFEQADRAVRRERAEAMVFAFQPGGEIDFDNLLEQATAYRNAVETTSRPVSVHRQLPYRFTHAGREISGRLDWVFERPDGQLVLHRYVHLSRKQFESTAGLRLAEVALDKLAAEQLLGQTVAEVQLHLPAAACWYQLID